MLKDFFDSVVMVTWSDWHTEMRSNRYHYARRFSRHLPVIFVQADLKENTYRFEETELEEVTILHVPDHLELPDLYGRPQTQILTKALREKKILKPLVWVYNWLFFDFIIHQYSPLKVFHATEAYFCEDFDAVPPCLDDLTRTLDHCDILVAVSEGVRESYIESEKFNRDTLVITNGCDYEFWTYDSAMPDSLKSSAGKNIALYQGGIHSKVDFTLVYDVASRMPGWEFWFCGNLAITDDEKTLWDNLCALGNFTYLGNLSADKLKEYMQRATLGLIPFVKNDWIIKRSFPLKAFEYVACGLPVVTVPIQSLLPYSEVFNFAQTAEDFISEMERAGQTRYEQEYIQARSAIAKKHDYDEKFDILCTFMEKILKSPAEPAEHAHNILILYDTNSLHVATIIEHLESFAKYSRNSVFYANACNGAPCNMDLSPFDALIIHYSVRLSLDWHLSPSFAEAIRTYNGLKILFIQDEYENTNTACDWIEDLGIHIVYTCVPDEYLDLVYPRERYPYVEFKRTLTGFVPMKLKSRQRVKPISKRKYIIGYRGRPLSYWYGMLGQEKINIGKRMRKFCDERNIECSIEWEEEKRIYGEHWYRFLEDSRATLGTESGSNVFDYDGSISNSIRSALKEQPGMSFDEAYEKLLKDHEGKIIMNQISPKIFEAISHFTALILFEGSYSGVVIPHIHYIPLKKDFSNIDEVLSKVCDLAYVEELTRRAYEDIIVSGKFSYREFIKGFDEIISQRLRNGKGARPVSAIIACNHSCEDWMTYHKDSLVWSLPLNTNSLPPKFVLCDFEEQKPSPPVERNTYKDRIKKMMKQYWMILPYDFRQKIKPYIKPPIETIRKKYRMLKSKLSRLKDKE